MIEDSEDAFFWGAALGITLMFLFSVWMATPDSVWRKEAVEKGHAEYYLDKEFKRQWRWKALP